MTVTAKFIRAEPETGATVRWLNFRELHHATPTDRIINPPHPDTRQITARKVRTWRYDARLLTVAPTRA